MTNQHKVPRVVWQGVPIDFTAVFRVSLSIDPDDEDEAVRVWVEGLDQDRLGDPHWYDAEVGCPAYQQAVADALSQLPEFTPPPSKETP